MSGNIWEWCWDKCAADYCLVSLGIDPTGPEQSQKDKYFGGWDRIREGEPSIKTMKAAK